MEEREIFINLQVLLKSNFIKPSEVLLKLESNSKLIYIISY